MCNLYLNPLVYVKIDDYKNLENIVNIYSIISLLVKFLIIWSLHDYNCELKCQTHYYFWIII